MSAAIEDTLEQIALILGVQKSMLLPDVEFGAMRTWDSFAHLEVMLVLEKNFGVTIDEENIRRYTSIAAILTLIEKERR